MAKFLTELDARLLDDDKIWELRGPLGYHSDILGCDAEAPTNFQTDFASIPRIPVVYTILGDTAHREGVIHDYFYRIDSVPVVDRSTADLIIYEAMRARRKPWYKCCAVYLGVRLGGWTAYHKHKVADKLYKECSIIEQT